MLLRLMMAGGAVMFTVDHPYFVAFGALIYFFTQVINSEEKEMLLEAANKGIVWLTQFNRFSRLKGLTMREGRQVASAIIEPVFNNLEPEYLKELSTNLELQDALNSFVVTYVNKMNEPQETDWWAIDERPFFPLENALMHEDEIERYTNFIKWAVPCFDFNQPYNRKAHRVLFKKLKSVFRNSDGTINNEIGNQAVIDLEYRIRLERDNAFDCPNSADTTFDFFYNQEYLNTKIIS